MFLKDWSVLTLASSIGPILIWRNYTLFACLAIGFIQFVQNLQQLPCDVSKGIHLRKRGNCTSELHLPDGDAFLSRILLVECLYNISGPLLQGDFLADACLTLIIIHHASICSLQKIVEGNFLISLFMEKKSLRSS